MGGMNGELPGGLFRDEAAGMWLGGNMSYWSVKVGLELVWDKGFRRVPLLVKRWILSFYVDEPAEKW